MILEACVENVSLIEQYIKSGSTRIELCDNLYKGGTTVSIGMLEYAKKICDRYKIDIAYMIRPRGGDFIYSSDEINIMKKDIKIAAQYNIHRFVFGAITKDKRLDEKLAHMMINYARDIGINNCEMVFHMAFDLISDKNERLKAIKTLSNLGYTTILTHGYHEKNDIMDNIDILNKYILKAKKAGIEIMPGGGINYKNKDDVIKRLINVTSLHGTKIVKI